MLVGLDIAAIILKTDVKDLLDLIDSEVKQANKKKKKVEKRQQREINLAQKTAAGIAPSSLNTSACHFLLSSIAFAGGASNASADSTFLTLFASGDLLSTILGRFLSFVASGYSLFTVFGYFLSFVARGSLSSIVSGCCLSPITGSGFFFTVLDRLLSLVASGGLLSSISSCFLPLVADGGFLSLVPFAGSQTLFLTNISSCVRYFSLFFLPFFHSFLSFLLTPFARNLAPLIEKRLFNIVFITQMPIALI